MICKKAFLLQVPLIITMIQKFKQDSNQIESGSRHNDQPIDESPNQPDGQEKREKQPVIFFHRIHLPPIAKLLFYSTLNAFFYLSRRENRDYWLQGDEFFPKLLYHYVRLLI